MADGSKIEWTDATWNPVTGCSVVSPGCTNCYAMRLAGTRMKHHWSRVGLTEHSKAGPVWNGQVRFNEEWLDQPLNWSRPRMVFVCAHGDLFHESVPDEWIDRVFAVMALAPQHTFQVLTKRPHRMRDYLSTPNRHDLIAERWNWGSTLNYRGDNRLAGLWPLSNVWLGTSIEDQERAAERIPHLLETPAAVRWLSIEPLLGPVDLNNIKIVAGTDGWLSAFNGAAWPNMGAVDWVVVGGESGPGARPMHPDWVRPIGGQCQAYDVPFFFKQWGDWFVFDKDYPGIIRSHGAISVHPPADRAIDYTEEHPRYVNVYRHDRVRELDNGDVAVRMGKKLTGRLLDGLEYSEYPHVDS